MKINYRYLVASVITFLIEVYIAVFVNDNIIRPFVGDILVVVLVYTILKIFITKHIKYLPIYIFIFACVIEMGQYFNVLGILHLEKFRLAQIIMGSTFDVKDILCYFIGTVIIIFMNKGELK